MKGLTLWIMTKVQYDAYGNAEILQSFVKPAHDSSIKKKEKKVLKRTHKELVEAGEKQLW